MKKIFFLMFYVTIVLCENQNDLNDSLHEFSEKRNELLLMMVHVTT